jgi:hypothetical protein
MNSLVATQRDAVRPLYFDASQGLYLVKGPITPQPAGRPTPSGDRMTMGKAKAAGDTAAREKARALDRDEEIVEVVLFSQSP